MGVTVEKLVGRGGERKNRDPPFFWLERETPEKRSQRARETC